MNRITTLIIGTITALAIGAIALWPTYVDHKVNVARAASLPTMAPVTADYLNRDRLIAFWEKAVDEKHPGDMISPRILAGQYLQRYREHGDVGDVLRAIHAANISLKNQSYGNISAEAELAGAYLELHRFRDSLAITRHMERENPIDPELREREASLDLELGRYGAANSIIRKLPPPTNFDISQSTLLTRWNELTGHLAKAREIFQRPQALENSAFDAPAQSRAWFFFRAGELAFEAGDNDAAIADEKQALVVFPNYADALRSEARFECATKRWEACLASAKASANVIPYPETLGYEVDADRALGDSLGATQTDALIVTIEKIGNTQRISDRLLAIYYSEHRERSQDAYRIARRELEARDDILTEDTLAWAAAMDGRWNEARIASAKAMRYHTENSLLLYHAGAIAEHFGDRTTAKADYQKALALNSQFHAVYADDARAQLAKL